MSSEDEQIATSADTQIFAFEPDPFKFSFDHYLRENIGEALSCALTYAVLYRPEDPIEFISEFLIDWSRKLTDHPSTEFSSTMNKSEENDRKDSLKEISSESDNHLSSFQHEGSSFDLQHDNEEQEIPRQFLHLHDTATGFDDDHNHPHRCQNGNLTDLSYFSQLRKKIINCDES